MRKKSYVIDVLYRMKSQLVNSRGAYCIHRYVSLSECLVPNTVKSEKYDYASRMSEKRKSYRVRCERVRLSLLLL